MSGSGRKGTGNHVYRKNRALLLAHTDVCGICGHPGAKTADHVIPARSWPKDAYGRPLPGMDSLANLQPAHGTMGPGRPPNYCKICFALCNQSRGAAIVRRPTSRDWFAAS